MNTNREVSTLQIKDHVKLIEILNTLQPMGARLFLYFLCNHRADTPFYCTLYNMSLEAKVKNPQRAIADILDKGYMTRKKNSSGTYQYTIHIDLIG